MRVGLGVMYWSPLDFWDATPVELYIAIEGWQDANTKDGHERSEPLTVEEMEVLMRKFPDGKA